MPACAGTTPRSSLDHLVGELLQLQRHLEAERLGGLEVDDELEFARLHDREIAGLLAFEDAASIDADEFVYVVDARAVTDQPAHIDKFTPEINGGQRVTRRQRDDLRMSAEKKCIGTDQQCATGLLHQVCEGRINLATGAGAKDFDWKPKRRSARLQVFDNGIGKRSVGVDERDEAVGSGRQLTQHPELLWHQLHSL